MAMCAKVTERKCRWQVVEEFHASALAAFQAYGRPLEVVALLKYPGKVLSMSHN